MEPCAYSNHLSIRCSGPVIFTAHDRRGCRKVCLAHAQWIAGNSIMQGHGASCPETILAQRKIKP
jgi:hypothetical protein